MVDMHRAGTLTGVKPDDKSSVTSTTRPGNARDACWHTLLRRAASAAVPMLEGVQTRFNASLPVSRRCR